jgi:hypothetical protein
VKKLNDDGEDVERVQASTNVACVKIENCIKDTNKPFRRQKKSERKQKKRGNQNDIKSIRKNCR